MDKNKEPDQNPVKVFTLQEATHLLPVITRHLKSLQRLRDVVLALEVEIDALELIAGDKEGRSQLLERKLKDHNQIVEEFYEVVNEIHSLGCYLKDPNLGLIDFYAMLEGRMVFLCWKLGEAEIGHWHEIESGYTDRRSLQSEGRGESEVEDAEENP